MCVNKTFSQLDGSVVTNGYYSIRFVMENDSPRFVLNDVMKSLGYTAPYVSATTYRKRFGLGKVINDRNQLVIYASKEEAEKIFAHLYLITADFREFWENEVVPATDHKYAALRTETATLKKEVNSEKRINADLKRIRDELKKENSDLAEKIAGLLKERATIQEILGAA